MSQVFRKRYQHKFTIGLVTLSALLFLFPANVPATPIGEYQQNLKNAVAAIEALFELDEEDSEYPTKVKQTIDGIRTSLPRQQTVEAGAEVYKVDNTGLHEALDGVEKSEDQIEAIRQLLEKVTALEQRVTERQSATASGESKGWAKSRLESILARPEYASGARGPNALTRLILDIVRWLQSIFPQAQPMEPGRALSVSRVVQIVVVVLAVLVLAYVAKISITKFKRSKKYKPAKKREARIVLGERLEPEDTSTNLLSEAEALAKRGELRAAIRKAYVALLVELGDRKIISLAQHKTNRDYLRGLRDVPQLHSQMRGLTDSFERHWYGFAEANENDWQEFRAGYLATLQTGK
jgi:hypothetical protein